jgi:hypothetical protein
MTTVTMREPRAAVTPPPGFEPQPGFGPQPAGDLLVGQAADDGMPGDDTQEKGMADLLASIPNYAVSAPRSATYFGTKWEVFDVTFGSPKRVVTVRQLNVADDWDLSEIAGGGTENTTWMAYAKAATSVMEIDGAPVLRKGDLDKALLRRVLRALGTEGVWAVLLVMNGHTSAQHTDVIQTAKN